jgi:hypothetical protein
VEGQKIAFWLDDMQISESITDSCGSANKAGIAFGKKVNAVV